VARAAPGGTAGEAGDSEAAAAQGPVTLDRFDGVDRAGRRVAAEADVERVSDSAQPALVEAHAGKEQAGKR
jgi:hypothetical protein